MLKFFTGLVATALLLAPVFSFAASASYEIRPGDTLQFEVLQDSTLNRQLLVLPDGTVTVPMIGPVQAAGRTVEQLQASVAHGLAPNFSTKPTVYLSVEALAPAAKTTTGPTITVYVMGQVNKSGEVTVPKGATLLQALAVGGGFTSFAAQKRIELLREDSAGKQEAYRFDYSALLSGDGARAIVLQPGDVIVVPQRRLFE